MTFDVDSSALFDMIHKMDSNMAPIGERVISTMLLGRAHWSDAIGMHMYGVEFIGAEPAPEVPAESVSRETSPGDGQ